MAIYTAFFIDLSVGRRTNYLTVFIVVRGMHLFTKRRNIKPYQMYLNSVLLSYNN